METILSLDKNILGGISFCLISLILSPQSNKPSIRRLLTEVILACLLTAFIIETWLTASSLFTCCLVGFAIGFIIDDVYANIVNTVPAFVKDVITDILIGIRLKVKRFFKMR